MKFLSFFSPSFRLLALAAVMVFSAGSVNATSGGVDENGCHDSAKKGFHCHPERAKKSGGGSWAGTSSTDRSQAERDKRLKRECKGRPNAGACLGYATP